MSYAPYSADATAADTPATAAQIRTDMKVLAPYTHAIRTYSSTNGGELVPEIAGEYGLKVTAGAWVDKHNDRNERELRSVVDLARKNRNVNAIVVGNETIYRADQTVPELIKKIQRVKRETGVPVTTGEIWHVWIEHPELASAVDFIAAHVLPYWEGIPDTAAVDQAVRVYNLLRKTFPGKRIVIAEFGWPSAGYNRHGAQPDPQVQAQVIRQFVNRADAMGIDYNIIEAFDQPWKTFEGSVGMYWGMFNAQREPKFAWVGPISNTDYWKIGLVAVLAGLLFSLAILPKRVNLTQGVILAAAANAVGAWCAAAFAYWSSHYFVFGAAIEFGLGMILLLPLIVIGLSRIDEITAIVFGTRPKRLIDGRHALAPSGVQPKVSIHIPAYREPPEMLIATIDSVARLEYPDFECIVIINNTPEESFWRPVEEHCRTLGDRFKFMRVDNLQGFKAGALRLALDATAPDAEIIGVLDADYVVHPDWLKDLAPAFADPKVGLVQAPQDHRDGNRSPLHRAMNGEYAGFFDIGMVQRNESNAIIVHGTMCLVRRAALVAAGGWSSDTICEDTDLGLTILELGYDAHYTDRRYGHGLLPDSYEAYRKQRHRWAYGGFQIIKKHWRRFLPGASHLSVQQRIQFSFGWLNWLGAETLGVAVVLANLLWVPFILFLGIAIPDRILTIPIIVAFGISALHFLLLYRRRVSIGGGETAGAMVAAMSLQWTVARAVATGLIKNHLPFLRTAKGGKATDAKRFAALPEAVIAGLLMASAGALWFTNFDSVHEIDIYAAVLFVQSLTFTAAALIALFEESRTNSFLYWEDLSARTLAFIGRRAAIAAQPSEVMITSDVLHDKRTDVMP